MHINTKVVFEWDDKAQEYRETSSEGYEYDGEMMLMQQTDPPLSWRNQIGSHLTTQLGLGAEDEGNWISPLFSFFGNQWEKNQAKPDYMKPDQLRSDMLQGMDPTIGGYEDVGKMIYGGGPIMDAARQQMRSGLHDASAQTSNQMNTQLAQRGVGGLESILNRKNSSEMMEQMKKGEGDLTRYGIEAGLKGLEGTTDIRGGVNTAVANLKAYNMHNKNKYRAENAVGSSIPWQGLARGALSTFGNYLENYGGV